MPLASLPIMFAVAGATTKRSARSASAICSRGAGPSSNILTYTGLCESVSKVSGATNRAAFSVMTTWTLAPALTKSRITSPIL